MDQNGDEIVWFIIHREIHPIFLLRTSSLLHSLILFSLALCLQKYIFLKIHINCEHIGAT